MDSKIILIGMYEKENEELIRNYICENKKRYLFRKEPFLFALLLV